MMKHVVANLFFALLLNASPFAFARAALGKSDATMESNVQSRSITTRAMLKKNEVQSLSQLTATKDRELLGCRTILEIVLAHPSLFSTLATAVGVVPGLADTLDDPDAELTLFAPTNNAFTRAFDTYIPVPIEEFLELPEAVADTLLYHAVGGTFYTPQLPSTVTTLQNETIGINRGKLRITLDPFVPESVQVIGPNIPACRSVVHVIDLVMVPESVAVLF